MLSVLVAAAPRGIPPGFTGALMLLALGMGVVFLVLTGLTLVMWGIGKVARDRPAAAAPAQVQPVETPEAPAASAEVATSPTVRISRGGPLSGAELAAVGTAVALEGSGPSAAEVAAIATALACRAGGASPGERIRVVHEVEEAGGGAWGSAAFAGRGGASMPALRRG
jgi:Na+-transporting methylmalonyl-CoA/oxaloacetate decarboxylase gamma subunit